MFVAQQSRCSRATAHSVGAGACAPGLQSSSFLGRLKPGLVRFRTASRRFKQSGAPLPRYCSALTRLFAAAYPNEVWVMRVGNDVPRLATILHHNRATREFAWCSRRRHGGDMLVVTSGIAGFTVWEEGEDGEAGTAVAVPVPASASFSAPCLLRPADTSRLAESPFAVERAAFDLDGSSVLLSDRSTFAVASQP